MVDRIRKRLDRNRPMTSISLRMPEDVIEDLKAVAPLVGFSGYQPLIRAYIGQGLRKDLERLEGDRIARMLAGLRRHGIQEGVLAKVLAEMEITDEAETGVTDTHETLPASGR